MFEAFLKPFDGFLPSDFSSYEPEKWSSNLHNLPRMQVKQKLSALASMLKTDVEGLNLDLEHETSAERPSIWNQKQVRAQWLFYSRNEKAKKDLLSIIDRNRSIAENIDDPAHHHRHAVLGVRIDADGAAVLFGVHRSAWLDRQNLERKWADEYERQKLASLLRELSDDEFVLRADDETRPLPDLDEAALNDLLADTSSIERWFVIERRFGPEDARVASAGFADVVIAVLARLAPLYRFLAWSRENDFAKVAQQVTEEKKAKRRSKSAPFEEGDNVQVVGGLFSGQKGSVMGYDRAGKIKVKVGNLTLPISAGALKLLSR